VCAWCHCVLEVHRKIWQTEVIILIHKKGDKREYINYQAMSLLSLPGKVYAKSGADPEGAISPLKPTKVTLFIMILYNSENSICDLRPFCRPFFCHSSLVKYTSSLLQQ